MWHGKTWRLSCAQMPDKEKDIIKQLIEGMIIKYETQHWSANAK